MKKQMEPNKSVTEGQQQTGARSTAWKEISTAWKNVSTAWKKVSN
jgi:hypothetical protein